LYETTKIGSDSSVTWGPTIVATVIAFFVGLAVIAWLLRWVSTRSYTPFVIYRIAAGALIIVLLTTGKLTA
jgi:undecaprenyl-diphosphatase